MSKQSKMTGADYLLLLLYLDNCSAINGAIRITKMMFDVILTPNSNPDLVANNLKDLLPSKRYLDAFPKNKVSFYYEGFGPYFSLSK